MTPTKRAVIKHGNERWELDYGLDDTGKKRRRFFATEALADQEIKRCEKVSKSHGEFWVRLSPLERSATVSVLQQIKAKELTPGRVWEDYQGWSKDADKQDSKTPMAYSLVVEEFKRRKLEAGKTPRYVNNTADFFMRFGAGREKQNIHEIPASDLEEWIRGQVEEHAWSLSTKRTYQQLFSSLWEVVIAKGWATLNIVDRLDPVTVIAPPVEIYSNDTAMQIMAAAMSTPATHQVIAPLALGFFGCMRPEEVASVKALEAGMTGKHLFGWHDIDLKNGLIKVRPEIAKTGDQRTIRLQPSAVA